MMLTDFLPTTKKECQLRGWDELDVILFSGDAYVDHPSFGAAVIGRTLEAHGYKVGVVISEISRNWASHVCSLAFRQGQWTLW